jgi:hypothetical protein
MPKGEIPVVKSDGEAVKTPVKRANASRAPRVGRRPIESSQSSLGDRAKGDGRSSADRSELRANSKLALLVGLLSRDRGATIEELMGATNWLSHTTRAALTRLRQRRFGLERVNGETSGASIYRLMAQQSRAQGATR